MSLLSPFVRDHPSHLGISGLDKMGLDGFGRAWYGGANVGFDFANVWLNGLHAGACGEGGFCIAKLKTS